MTERKNTNAVAVNAQPEMERIVWDDDQDVDRDYIRCLCGGWSCRPLSSFDGELVCSYCWKKFLECKAS